MSCDCAAEERRLGAARPELPRASLCAAARAGGSKDGPTTLRPLRQVAVELLEQHLVLIGVG